MNILESNQKGYSGVCGWSIEIAKFSSVNVFPKQFRLEHIGSVALNAGEEWQVLEFLPETPKPESKRDFKSGKAIFRFSCTGNIIKPDAERLVAILDYEDEDLLVRFKDMNGKLYYVGDKSAPAVLTVLDRRWKNKDLDRFESIISINYSGAYPILEGN